MRQNSVTKVLHLRGKKQIVPELQMSCMCFTQVKESSYVDTVYTKQVPCRKSPNPSEYSKGILPLLATRAIAFPFCEIPFIHCFAQAWNRADILPLAQSALGGLSCMSPQEEDGYRQTAGKGFSLQTTRHLFHQQGFFCCFGSSSRIWKIQPSCRLKRHHFMTRSVRRNEAF